MRTHILHFRFEIVKFNNKTNRKSHLNRKTKQQHKIIKFPRLRVNTSIRPIRIIRLSSETLPNIHTPHFFTSSRERPTPGLTPRKTHPLPPNYPPFGGPPPLPSASEKCRWHGAGGLRPCCTCRWADSAAAHHPLLCRPPTPPTGPGIDLSVMAARWTCGHLALPRQPLFCDRTINDIVWLFLFDSAVVVFFLFRWNFALCRVVKGMGVVFWGFRLKKKSIDLTFLVILRTFCELFLTNHYIYKFPLMNQSTINNIFEHPFQITYLFQTWKK